MIFRAGRTRALMAVAGISVVAGLGLWGWTAWRVRRSLEAVVADEAALAYLPVPVPEAWPERWGGGDVHRVAVSDSAVLCAGAFGVRENGRDISRGLPTLRASALVLWRGRPLVGLEAGGLFLWREGRWEELRSGFGVLHVRDLAETQGGELVVGAQEGLFRAAWGANRLVRVDRRPVRSLAVDAGGKVLAGGESGLIQVEGRRVTVHPTPDPWVDWVGLQGDRVTVLTPLGLASGPLGSLPLPLAGGDLATSAAAVGDRLYGAGGGHLLRYEGANRRGAVEYLPSPVRRVFEAGGMAFADTDQGLFQRGTEGWTLASPRPEGLPAGPAHVTAVAPLGDRLVLGLFDGGLAAASQGLGPFVAVPGSEAWGVNALLASGGVLHVASLRGLARFDGRRLSESPEVAGGGAYALVPDAQGLAIGTGQGVRLGDGRFLSAFHGLPGNQALALAFQGQDLFVGTPSGLGAVRGGRVLWRTTSGEGLLPHPWVTALALHGGDLYVGTYGGGVVRRRARAETPKGAGDFMTFQETQGIKVNPGCLAILDGRLYLGTDGKGLWVLAPDGGRFWRLDVALPSSRVTALLGHGGHLYVGTDEGLSRLTPNLLRELNARASGV